MEQTAAKREGDTNNRPETIYLITVECDGAVCDVWCEDPAPGTDMDPAEATRYVRADLLEQEVRFHRGAVEGWADEATALVDSREECKRLVEKNQALEQCLEDVKRLTRELDIALNAAGAAEQASLCDLMAQIRKEGPGPIFVKKPVIPRFIRDMATLITTQDNRITADPLFCVFQKREIVTDADYGYDRIVWCSDEGEADDETAQHLDELREDVDSDHWHESEIKLDGVEWRRLAVKKIDEFVTACFTEQGCKDFLAINGHNLRKPFIYVTSLFRNEEMKALRNWIMSQDTGNRRQVGEEVSA
ncbi:hypothetical protein [Marinobacterium iners]|uniref:Uncharacterized protein n=1 Tax=Marinobacterium iners DSM 11526 TaxID=1122198 RepID=A0A1H3X9N9_9GAMM|nr:hypothetical protein [Marinobacterium iners]SDZ95374.1 hypothetical protein SAMN02745729_10166 [Marinobacterium iners DSM 11526]